MDNRFTNHLSNRRFNRCVKWALYAALLSVVLSPGVQAARLVEDRGDKAGAALKSPPPGPEEVPSAKPLAPSDRITINFDNADLRSVIKFISDLTGKNFIVDDKVKGNVTILSPTEITVGEAYQVFLATLEMKGFTVVEAGKVTKIVPSKEARHRDITTIKGEAIEQVGREDRIITQIVPLNFADADTLKGMFTPMVSKDSHIVAYTPTNTLFITDYASNIHRLMSIIRDMDVEGSEDKITVIPLKFASAQTLVSELLSLVETRRTQQAARRPPRRQPAAPAEESAITVTKLIADERTNSLILVANRIDTQKIMNLVKKLDTPLPPGQDRIHVYYLENATAEELVQVLTQLPTKVAAVKAGGKAAAGPRAPILGEEVQILADKPTNALIIIASPQDYETLKSVIEKLDIMRSQVLVEGLIAEVSLNKLKQLGVEWRYLSHEQAGNLRWFGGTGGPTKPNLDLGGTAGELLLGVFKGPITIAGQEFLNMSAVIRALQTASDVNILSTPHILTLDNEEAEIIVAENRPFLRSQTGTAESTTTEQGTITTGVIQTFEFKDVGITLRITPQISKGKFVRLNIFQEVSDVLPETVAEGAFATFKRQAKTTVVVEDGQTVVIGGLIQDTQRGSQSGIPCLANVPLLGAAFRTRSADETKRNLLIFITPHILTTPTAVAEITEQKRRESEKRKIEYEEGLREDLKETLDMIME